MAQNVIYANGSRDVLIPAGQKIAIATIGEGDADISYKRGNSWESVQTLKNAQVILGTFSDARTVRIQAKEDSVYYNVGTNPGTDVWMGYAKDSNNNVTGLVGPDGVRVLSLNRSLDRPPTVFDNASKGHSTATFWQHAGRMYQPISCDTTQATWALVEPVGAKFVDTMGAANTIFAGGLIAMKAGYGLGATDYACDVSVTIAATPTTVTIRMLPNGELDNASMQAAIGRADVGTKVTCTRLYDQSGAGWHAVADGANACPLVEFDSFLNRYVLTFGVLGTGSRTLRWPVGFTAQQTTNGIFALGRSVATATNGKCTLAQLGDVSSSAQSALQFTQSANTLNARFVVNAGYTQLSGNACLPCGPAALVYSSAGATLRADINEATSSTSVTSNATLFTGGYIGTLNPTSTWQAALKFVGIAVSSTAITAAQSLILRRGAYVTLNYKPQIRDQIICVGDSRTEGTQDTASMQDSVGLQLQNRLPDFEVFNYGSGAATTTTITNTVAPTVVTRFRASANNYVVLLIGINNLVSGTSVATTLAGIKSNIATFKTAGFTVILINELATTLTTNAANTNMALLRAQISSEGTSGMGCDSIVDLNVYAPFATPSNAAFYPDGVHPVNALFSTWASAIVSLFQTTGPITNKT